MALNGVWNDAKIGQHLHGFLRPYTKFLHPWNRRVILRAWPADSELRRELRARKTTRATQSRRIEIKIPGISGVIRYAVFNAAYLLRHHGDRA
jgi:hypothetical protein